MQRFAGLLPGKPGRMDYGLLALRIVVGLVLAGHGSQKLLGWFGGGGPRGTAGFFGDLGFRPPLVLATVAGLSEASGLAFAAGLLTPFAALAMASVMVVAVGSVHLRNGFWSTNGGYEYNLVLWTVAASVAATGPGRFSIDRAIGWDGSLSGLWLGIGVAVVSVLGGLAVLSTRELQPEAEATEAPLAREREREGVS
jgi:putative oxidoreductase